MSRIPPENETKSAETVTFRGFVFRVKSKELQTVAGEAVDLRSQSAEVLGVLAARPGEIVAKEALMEAVWADTFVTDDSLVQCIADIRRAVGDDRHNVVETFPKRGYRLNVDPSDAGAAVVVVGAGSRSRFFRRSIAVAALVALAFTVGVLPRGTVADRPGEPI
jgi:DNA-binding winged helix-turn-helix (wHTH) protein